MLKVGSHEIVPNNVIILLEEQTVFVKLQLLLPAQTEIGLLFVTIPG